MNYIYKIYCIYIINKTLTFHHWKNKLSDADNSNSATVKQQSEKGALAN